MDDDVAQLDDDDDEAGGDYGAEEDDADRHLEDNGDDDGGDDEYYLEQSTAAAATAHTARVFKPDCRRPPYTTATATAPRPTLEIMCLDIDHVPDEKDWSKPVVRIFGSTAAGNSVAVFVHNFKPYIYIETLAGFDFKRDIEALKTALEMATQTAAKVRYTCIIDATLCTAESLVDYKSVHAPFVKVTVASPKVVKAMRTVLETTGLSLKGSTALVRMKTYESDVSYPLRFTLDTKLSPAGWFTLPSNTYLVTKATSKDQVSTYCQLEVHCDYKTIEPHDHALPEWRHIAPLRILSFDIECQGQPGHFPSAETDPVITISSVLWSYGHAAAPPLKYVFQLDSCDPLHDIAVYSCATEAELLETWRDFVISADPDVLTGYNICNFDIPYMLGRGDALCKRLKRVLRIVELGRCIGVPSKVRETVYQSKAAGHNLIRSTNIAGRIQLDVLKAIKNEHKLRSYTLNAVSAHFLNKQKDDVHHTLIGTLQAGTPATRARLAKYCVKDAELPWSLINHLQLLANLVSMSRVTGVPMQMLLTRGQQIKVYTMILATTRLHNMIVPTQCLHQQGSASDSKGGVGYKGATVVDAKTGYYKDPIATLDFNSLYPSIMIAHNFCYSTRTTATSGHGGIRTPTGAYFVPATVRQGILPLILKRLITERKETRAQIKDCKNDGERAVLNGRQLAIKISANSVYGFTGVVAGGMLPCPDIASSVTGIGRKMIEWVPLLIAEAAAIPANGFPRQPDVIYGDTDSVMVNFGPVSVAEAIRLGNIAAAYITKRMPPPMKIEFEKVYKPYLLFSKKRYAGMYWTRPERADKLDSKGIETVRRDNCRFVSGSVGRYLELLIKEEQELMTCFEYLIAKVRELMDGHVDMSKLVVSKQLSKPVYAAPVAHAELAKRLAKRDPSSAPRIGDRVSFVVVQGGDKKTKMCDLVEDPVWVADHQMPLNLDYYLRRQVLKPFIRMATPILELIYRRPEHCIPPDALRPPTPNYKQWCLLCQNSTTTAGAKKPVPCKAISVCAKCVEQRLTATLSTRKRKQATFGTASTDFGKRTGLGTMERFTTKRARCRGCGCALPATQTRGPPVCVECRAAGVHQNLYIEAMGAVRESERVVTGIMSQCQRCQEKHFEKNECSNNDCPIFYARKTAHQDHLSAAKALAEIGADW